MHLQKLLLEGRRRSKVSERKDVCFQKEEFKSNIVVMPSDYVKCSVLDILGFERACAEMCVRKVICSSKDSASLTSMNLAVRTRNNLA